MGLISNYEKVRDVLDFVRNGATGVSDGIKRIRAGFSGNSLDEVNAGELLATMKLNEMVEEGEEKKAKNKVKTILIVIAVLAIIGVICYALYKYFSPDYLDEYEDDMEDEFEDDFFEDEDDEVVSPKLESEEASEDKED